MIEATNGANGSVIVSGSIKLRGGPVTTSATGMEVLPSQFLKIELLLLI
jgi:hypothetical protein